MDLHLLKVLYSVHLYTLELLFFFLNVKLNILLIIFSSFYFEFNNYLNHKEFLRKYFIF